MFNTSPAVDVQISIDLSRNTLTDELAGVFLVVDALLDVKRRLSLELRLAVTVPVLDTGSTGVEEVGEVAVDTYFPRFEVSRSFKEMLNLGKLVIQ